MELKVTVKLDAWSPTARVNPFNGIERSVSFSAPNRATYSENPFNGIESRIQAGSIRFHGVSESIQWN